MENQQKESLNKEELLLRKQYLIDLCQVNLMIFPLFDCKTILSFFTTK